MFFSKKSKEKEPENANDNVRELAPFTTKFATYCRTIELIKPLEKRPAYWEAFQQTGSNNLWTAREVYVEEDDTGRELLSFKTVDKNLHFLDAINKLSAFEKMADEEAYKYTTTEQTAESLEQKHYIIMAEREGVVFSNTKRPYLANEHTGLPEGDGRFYAEDIDRAEERREEAASLPVVNVPSKRTPEENALTELFNNIVYRGNFEETLNALKDLKAYDAISKELNDITNSLSDCLYRDAYMTQSQWSAPKHKSISLNKMGGFKKYVTYEWSSAYDGYDVKDMPRFYNVLREIGHAHHKVDQCELTGRNKEKLKDIIYFFEATSNLLYARNLFALAVSKAGDTDYTEQIKLHEEIARTIFTKKLNVSNQDDLENIRQYILQGDRIDVPSFMTNFEDNYRKWRRELTSSHDKPFDASKLTAPPLPKMPKPGA